MRSLSSESLQHQYYRTLDTVLAAATAAILFFFLLSVPFLPFSLTQRWQFVIVLLAATVFFIARYVLLQQKGDLDLRYYATNIANPLIVGAIIQISGRTGLYFLILFALVLVASMAVLRFRHVVVCAILVGSYAAYLFFGVNSFGLNESEQFLAGSLVLMSLLVMTVFTYIILHEIVRQVADLEARKLDFIQDVSHELRTPLTVIKAAAVALRDPRIMRLGRSKAAPEVVEHLESAAQDLEVVTEKLSQDSKAKVQLTAPKRKRRAS